MKRNIFVLALIIFNMVCAAQTITNLVLDHADQPSLHIDKVLTTDDTTFVYCTFLALVDCNVDLRKTGVNTILKSLNKVNDDATKILMVEFYKNLLSGKTKCQSQKDAQKHLRRVENGIYDKPEY